MPLSLNISTMPPAATVRTRTASVQSDYESNVSYMDAQHQALARRTGASPAEQAEQLRSLENKARKWAKKFLYKVKAAAAKAEAQARQQAADTTPSSQSLRADADKVRNGRGALDTIDSVPSEPQSSTRPTPREAAARTPKADARPSGRGGQTTSSLRSSHRGPQAAAAPQQPYTPPAPSPVTGQPSQDSLRNGQSEQLSPQGQALDTPSHASGYSPAATTPVHGSAAMTSIPRRSHARSTEDSMASEPARLQPRHASDVVASVNAHLQRRPERVSSSELNPMLDSVKSESGGGESRSKKRFNYFNTLFKSKSGHRPGS